MSQVELYSLQSEKHRLLKPFIHDEVFLGPYCGVSIDSRTLRPGELFVAMPGERFDGHDYVRAAQEAGAGAVICERFVDGIQIKQFVVPSALQALTELATRHRQRLSLRVVALTGSNGKTSVKEMIARILPKPAFATPGNLNNHIGVPLSVLKLTSDHRFAVFELGASHIGEIANTVRIVQPNVALINNIAPAHVEGFGGIEGVARAKGEIYQGLAKGGTAVVNEGDDYAHFWDDLFVDCSVLRFSVDGSTPVHAKDLLYDDEGKASFVMVTPVGEAPLKMNVPGCHHVSNALAAASCALSLDLNLEQIIDGLQQFQGVSGRMTFYDGPHHSVIIDDTYNANLRSVLTALDVLSKRRGVRIFVFGDMGELGEWTTEHHREVGLVARRMGIEHVLTCGQHSLSTSQAFGEGARHYDEKSKLTADLIPLLKAEATVLVKGSRSSAMEKIVQELIG